MIFGITFFAVNLIAQLKWRQYIGCWKNHN